MKLKLCNLFLCLLLIITSSGCSLLFNKKKSNVDSTETSEIEEGQTFGTVENNNITGNNTNITNQSLGQIFYFDYDSYNLKTDAMNSLNAHAQLLNKQPNTKITLIGHTDERGTREYNMALGERRAKAVQNYLQLQGVKNTISIVSYGKELPAVQGSNEEAWAQNRRVELFNDGN